MIVICTTLSGCGGKGGGSSDAVSVSASPDSIAYGRTTKVSWSASSSARFNSSNFGLEESDFRGGSITDTPGTTSTYELKVGNEEGGTSTGRATVTMAKIAKSVLVAGDESKAGPGQIAAFLRTLTSGTVVLADAVPEPSDAYGVLVVSPTVFYSASGRGRAKRWLDAGKAVVLCGYAPRVLATGDAGDDDVSAIGSWFFGVDRMGDGPFFLGGIIRTSPEGLVRLSASIRGDYDEMSDKDGFLDGLGPQVDDLDHSDADGSWMCAYDVPSGGRLVWSASPVGFGDAPGGSFQQAFESAFRWAGQ